MKKNINKKPMNVYWAPFYDPVSDWSLLYPKPEILFNSLLRDKDVEAKNSSVFSCPAFSEKFKRLLVFRNALESSYKYNDKEVVSKTDFYLSTESRDNMLTNGPCIYFSLGYIFFSEEPLDAYFTPPFFHKPKYMKYGSIVPGEFDIGQWFRGYTSEIQMWNKSGDFNLEKDEPLFYVEFKTDRPIVLKEFYLNERLWEFGCASPKSSFIFGRIGLKKRYDMFKASGLREKILTEIKKNLVDQEPYRF